MYNSKNIVKKKKCILLKKNEKKEKLNKKFQKFFIGFIS